MDESSKELTEGMLIEELDCNSNVVKQSDKPDTRDERALIDVGSFRDNTELETKQNRFYEHFYLWLLNRLLNGFFEPCPSRVQNIIVQIMRWFLWSILFVLALLALSYLLLFLVNQEVGFRAKTMTKLIAF